MIISDIHGQPTDTPGEYVFSCERCGMRHTGRHSVETHYCGVGLPPRKPSLTTPSLLDKVKNFTTAAAKHVASGMPRASDEVVAQRFGICKGCEFLRDNACLKCGCPISREKKYMSKLAWADQSCPVGKWGPVATDK